MADLQFDTINDGDKLVQLIRDDDGKGVNSVEIVKLLSKDNVNKQVNGIPLILFYLNANRHLDIGVLEAFVHHGCDLNVQDHHGKTPLHLLFGLKMKTGPKQTMEQLVGLVNLFVSNGANPCLLDSFGNNVLMVAADSHLEDWYKVIRPLVLYPTNAMQLLDQRNRSGYDVMSLCVNSSCMVLSELESIAQDVDTKTTDDNGNNILHRLFLKSADNYQPTADGTECTMLSDMHGLDECPIKQGYMFPSYLQYLVESGANVSQKNNDGLVPLQVALLNYKRLHTCRQLDLLIPSTEVLYEQVPWSTSIVSLILNNYHYALVPLLEKLVNSGLNCSHEQTLPTVLSLKSYDVQVFLILIKGGARATINCIKQVLEGIDYMCNGQVSDNNYAKWVVLSILLKEGLQDDLVIVLNDAIPGLVKFLIRCYDDRQFGYVLPKLLDKGLVLKIDDIMELAKCTPMYTCRGLLEHVSRERVLELNAECPSLFERHVTQGKINDRWAFGDFVEAGIHVTVDTVVKLFNKQDTIEPVYRLIKLMTDEIKDELKETLPNAISHLIELVALHDGAKFNGCLILYNNFVKLMKLLVKLDFNVTINDLVQLFDARLPFSTLLRLVNTVNDEVKSQISVMIPDAIGQLIADQGRWNDNWIESCVGLIDTLVGLGTVIKVIDLKRALQANIENVIYFPIAYLNKNLDTSLKDEIQREMPDLLVNVFGLFSTNYFYDNKSLLMDTLTILLDKFELDVNCSNGTHGTFLHALISLSVKFPSYRKDLLLALDNVLARSELDLDKVRLVHMESVIVETELHSFEGYFESPVRPIDLAIQMKQYELVVKLILAGANCNGLDLTKLKDDQVQSLNTARLLYFSGHYHDIDGNRKLHEWIATLPVRWLQELAALSVRKNTSRTELNGIIKKFVFPQTVLDYFKLAHVQLECEPE